ncbi:uncharacterized protein LOC121386317 isoform X2 [Gigantopelta aegis]|uniref:uncharacterized protein LOC121386317 isoform X2 n=1 Tax=Gigantopelta aegis TaxID=1735272 RepID=UPI001B88E4A9|nr:uncharacterized protein LOC121386317 isoform X2 [Gigantopelta aegis]
MKLTIASAVVFVFVLTVSHVTAGKKRGYGLSDTVCLRPGIRGKKSKLLCETFEHIRSGLGWFRPDGKLVAYCTRNHTSCSEHWDFQGQYTSVIVTPTQNILVIESFNPDTDSGVWICKDLWREAPFSSCIKVDRENVTVKYSYASTSICCMKPGIKGQRAELGCEINGNTWLGIGWYRADGELVVSCNHSNSMCITDEKFTGQYTGVIDSPVQERLIIESFNPGTDAGQWVCKDMHPIASLSTCKKYTNSYLPPAAAKGGACVHVASTSMVISWIVSILAGNVQTTTSVYEP